MAKIKPATDIDLRSGKHGGQSIQNSRSGWTLKNNPIARTTRLLRQLYPKSFLLTCVQHWKNLTIEVQTDWETWAATYPQPSILDPARFLTGYELFVKRNYYLWLNAPELQAFMLSPKYETLVLSEISVTIDQTENVVDVTEPYLANFGFLPEPGQWLILKVLPYSCSSGQFFDIIEQSVEVLETYLDGLFVSLHLPANCPAITFSVFLSSPFTTSQKYAGTKYRYMGCFTATTFLALTDTPDSYDGQAGKTVAVREDESGLEFIEPSGGGLTCEDLVNCPTIQEIIDQLDTISEVIAGSGSTSVPAIHFGLIYNLWFDRALNTPLPNGFVLPSNADWSALKTFLGGETVASLKCKENNPEYWLTQIPIPSNSAKFNARGAGRRIFQTGAYAEFKETAYYWCSDVYQTLYGYDQRLIYSGTSFPQEFARRWQGAQLRGYRASTTLAEGQSGFVKGRTGQVYRTIVINGKEWMADNCVETTLQDGTVIQRITDNAAWIAATTPAWDYPNSNPELK